MNGTSTRKPTLSSILFFVAALSCTVPLQAQPLTTVQVSDNLVASNTIAEASTSRNLAVSTNGTIFVLYRNPTEGIVVKRSTDRGATFGAPVVVAPDNIEAEIATS